jgi:hypothetical protein
VIPRRASSLYGNMTHAGDRSSCPRRAHGDAHAPPHDCKPTYRLALPYVIRAVADVLCDCLLFSLQRPTLEPTPYPTWEPTPAPTQVRG